MTKKDYIIIATALQKTIKQAREESPTPAQARATVGFLEVLLDNMCDLFERDNSRFDAKRFKEYIAK